MKIRRATVKDISRIRALIRKYPEKLLQGHLPKANEFFIALDKKAVVGCVGLVIYSKRLGEIRSIAVQEEYQGQGIATQLIERAIREAKKRKVYELLTVTGAPELFAKHGFGTFNKEKLALLKVL